MFREMKFDKIVKTGAFGFLVLTLFLSGAFQAVAAQGNTPTAQKRTQPQRKPATERNFWALDQKTIDEQAPKAKQMTAALQAGTERKSEFDPYFQRYYFHRWVQPENVDKLNQYVRREFLATDLEKATGDARAYLIQKAFGAMNMMRKDAKIPPAARINAVVVLGLLYEDPEKTRLYAPALRALIEEYRDPKSPDSNKIMALNGIVRYAYVGIEDENIRTKTVPDLLKTLALDKTVPEERDSNLHEYFFRVNAVRGLAAYCKNELLSDEILNTLLTLIEDDGNIDEIRYEAAAAISEINYISATAANVNIDKDRIFEAIVSLSRYACEGEQKFIDEMRRSEQVKTTGGGSMGPMGGGSSMLDSGGGYGPGMPGMGGGAGDRSTARTELCVNRNKFHFGTIQNAIKGPGAIKSESNFLSLLKNDSAAQSKEKVETLEKTIKIIDEYVKFLKDGPKVPSRPSLGAMGASGAGRKNTKNALKVTMNDMYAELTVVSTKFNELFGLLSGSVASN